MHVTLRGNPGGSVEELLSAAERVERVAEDRFWRSGLNAFPDGSLAVSLSILEGSRRDQMRAVLTDLATSFAVQASDDVGRPVSIPVADQPAIVT